MDHFPAQGLQGHRAFRWQGDPQKKGWLAEQLLPLRWEPRAWNWVSKPSRGTLALETHPGTPGRLLAVRSRRVLEVSGRVADS